MSFQANLEMIEIAPALGLSMSTKDKSALSSVRRAAAVTLKVLKHGIVKLIEDAFNEAKSVSHDELAAKAEVLCEKPSTLNFNIPPGDLESCYFPIIQVLFPCATRTDQPVT